jgi:hypothetical protein
MTVIKAMLLLGGCKSMFFGSAVPAAIAKDCCPREMNFKG